MNAKSVTQYRKSNIYMHIDLKNGIDTDKCYAVLSYGIYAVLARKKHHLSTSRIQASLIMLPSTPIHSLDLP